MDAVDVLVAIAVGFIGGVASGLFGVGGGAIFVPAMVLLLGEEQHTAQGVSLAVIVLTAISGSYVNLRHNNVEKTVFAAVTPVAVIAVLGSSYVANQLSAETLQRIFGVAVVLVALRMFWTTWRDRGAARRTE
jgi:uncharacterized membrane protein YfcA